MQPRLQVSLLIAQRGEGWGKDILGGSHGFQGGQRGSAITKRVLHKERTTINYQWGEGKLRSKDLKRLGFDFRGELSFIFFSNGPDNTNNISLQYFSELLLTKNKKLVKKGDVIKNVQYAETLETVRDNPDSFYNGTLASKILRDIKKVNGSVTEEDLRSYTWILRDPYQSNIRDMKMYLTPPPTSGAVLALILNILRGRSCWQNDYSTSLKRILS